MNSKKAKSLLDAEKNDLDVNSTHKLKDYKFRAHNEEEEKNNNNTLSTIQLKMKLTGHFGDVKMTKAIDK